MASRFFFQNDPVEITYPVEDVATNSTKYPCDWSFKADTSTGDIVITGQVFPGKPDRYGNPCPDCQFQVTYKEDDNGNGDSVKICISDYYVDYDYADTGFKDEGLCADADGDLTNDETLQNFCPDDTCKVV